jgi:hypothetical protein
MRYTSARQTPCEVGSGSPSRGEIRPNSVKETGKASFKFRDFDVRPLLVISEMTIIKDHKMTDALRFNGGMIHEATCWFGGGDSLWFAAFGPATEARPA